MQLGLEAYNVRAAIYGMKGEWELAISDYTKAIELKPSSLESYYSRALAYKQLGKKSNAISDFRKILELTSNPALRQNVEKALKELQEN